MVCSCCCRTILMYKFIACKRPVHEWIRPSWNDGLIRTHFGFCKKQNDYSELWDLQKNCWSFIPWAWMQPVCNVHWWIYHWEELLRPNAAWISQVGSWVGFFLQYWGSWIESDGAPTCLLHNFVFPLELFPIGHVTIKLLRMTSTSEGCIVPLELVIVLITSWNFLQWKSRCLDLGLGFRVFVIRGHVLNAWWTRIINLELLAASKQSWVGCRSCESLLEFQSEDWCFPSSPCWRRTHKRIHKYRTGEPARWRGYGSRLLCWTELGRRKECPFRLASSGSTGCRIC